MVINPTGKSYVCVLHEYCQHAFEQQPRYVYKELGAPSATAAAVTASWQCLEHVAHTPATALGYIRINVRTLRAQRTAARRSRPLCSWATPSTAAGTARANAPRSSPPVRLRLRLRARRRDETRRAASSELFLPYCLVHASTSICGSWHRLSLALSMRCSSRHARASHPRLPRPPARALCRRCQRCH